MVMAGAYGIHGQRGVLVVARWQNPIMLLVGRADGTAVDAARVPGRLVTMATFCCCGQVSTFQGRGWILSRTEAPATRNEIERAATTNKWKKASKFVHGRTVEL